MMMLFALMGFTSVQAMYGDNKVYEFAEVMPEYPGGMNGLMTYMMNNLKYPEKAEKKKIEGRVLVSFIVEKDGRVSHIVVKNKVSKELDDEAVRMVKGMQKWTPGKMKGKPVRVRYILPVQFRLK